MIIKTQRESFSRRVDLPFVEIENECTPEEHGGSEIDHAHQIRVVKHTCLVRSNEHEEAYHPDEHDCMDKGRDNVLKREQSTDPIESRIGRSLNFTSLYTR